MKTLTLLLLAVLSLLFVRSFDNSSVVFSNDGPYGALCAERSRFPENAFGGWDNLNWLGDKFVMPGPDISAGMRWCFTFFTWPQIRIGYLLFLALLAVKWKFKLSFAKLFWGVLHTMAGAVFCLLVGTIVFQAGFETCERLCGGAGLFAVFYGMMIVGRDTEASYGNV